MIRKLLDYIFNIGWESKRHNGDLLQHTGPSFCEVAHLRFNVPSETHGCQKSARVLGTSDMEM
jgi:hypothetical protein